MIKTQTKTIQLVAGGATTSIPVEVSEQCLRCKRLKQDFITCSAFPEGIPEEIITGKFDHQKPFGGDGGKRYQPKD